MFFSLKRVFQGIIYSYNMNISKNLLEEYVNYVDTTKNLLRFIAYPNTMTQLLGHFLKSLPLSQYIDANPYPIIIQCRTKPDLNTLPNYALP